VDSVPIKIDDRLPAHHSLELENIFVMTETRATTQDIRPLKIIILNLMPTKIETETQILRLLSNSPLQVDIELLQVTSHTSKHTSQEHMLKFYKTFDDVKEKKFDGMIVTGAPVELMDFEEVDYWDELCEIFDWAAKNVYSTYNICWGAQAALYYHYGIKKYPLQEKLSGVYWHHVDRRSSMLVRGFDDQFLAPHSRYTEVRLSDLQACEKLRVIASSEEAGLYIAMTDGGRQVFITGHSEYDWDTLQNEYQRDLKQGIDPKIPENYYPGDDPSQPPVVRWRGHANLLYMNWLNYYVYQTTPYIIETIEPIK
jgi:homoserine O-succinyltransferase